MTTPTTPLPLPIQITATRDAIGGLLDAVLERENLTFDQWVELRAIALDARSDDSRKPYAERLVAEVGQISAKVTSGIEPRDLELTRVTLARMAAQARALAG